MPFISIRGLKKSYGPTLALDSIDLDIARGEVVGLVGESGSGKSTLGRCLIGLEKADAGFVTYKKQNLLSIDHKSLKALRRQVQMVFQDPYSSLNPRMTVEEIIMEPLEIHAVDSHAKRRERAHELLCQVGLGSSAATRYPHEFSGGQRQRISIARALALNPEFLVLDEPLSALDVSVQAQIIQLLQHLQRSYQLTYLFISHDLSVVRYFCDRIAVLYKGRLVEQAPTETLVNHPLHPYTEKLYAECT